MNLRTPLSLLFLCGVLGSATPAPAQEPEAVEQPAAPEASPAGPVGALQLATEARLLADSAARAEDLVQSLAEVDGLEAEVEEAERRHREMEALLASMVDADFVRIERLSRLQDHALLEGGRVEDLRSRILDRVAELEEVHTGWMERRTIWEARLEGLRADPGLDSRGLDSLGARDDVEAALLRIEEVLARTSTAVEAPLALQGRVEALRDQIAALGDRITRIQTRRAESRFERSGPFLFSSAHRDQLRRGGWRAWDPTANLRPAAYLAFVRDNVGLLTFHLLLALLTGSAIRALRSATTGEELPEWSRLLEHPWALGVLVSVVAAMTRVTLAPPMWDVLLWSLFGASASILAGGVVADRPLRLTVYLLSLLYPAFLLLEVSRVPEPVFRVGLAAVAACAVPLFLLLAREEGSLPEGRPDSVGDRVRGSWPLLLGTGVWVGVLAALWVGFDALARWALHATAMSAAVVYSVALGFALVRGADDTLSRVETDGSLLRRAGLLLARRSGLAIRVALVVVGGLVFLDIWEIAGSPITTWRAVMAAGFTVGSFEVSVGRVLLGASVVYLTVVLSGLVRTLVASSPDGDASKGGGRSPVHAGRGVTESITRLAQYALFTVGLIVALAVTGVELQNFAIIAGALGIGVGFGLQNVVNNFASGLILLFERPVRVGDTVVVGDTWGTIQKIGLRSTLMLTLDESEMIVPNGDLVSEKVINWTLSSPIARVFLPVPVAYGSPVAQVQEILMEAAFAHPSVLREPAPQALFVAFGESSLDFELRVWVQDIRPRLEMRSAVLTDLDRRLREAGISIPFPQRDLHLRSIDEAALRRAPGGAPADGSGES